MDSRIAIFNMQDGIPMKRRKYPEIWYWDNERKTIMIKYPTGHTDEKLFAMNDQDHIDYNDSAQKTPTVRKNVRGMNAPITNNATIIPTGFSSGIVGFSWPDVLQNAVIRCIALLFQEKHFR